VKVDRYTKIVLTVIAVALSTLAFKGIVAPQPAVAAAPALGEGRYQIDAEGQVVIDKRSETLYRTQYIFNTDAARGPLNRASVLDTETGYPVAEVNR
jgi:hypothetical protein